MTRARPSSNLLNDVHQLLGQRIRVHFNLLNTLWSVTALTGEHKGCVVTYLDDIALRAGPDRAVEFKVSSAGRKRRLRSGQRNVHAWCFGIAAAPDTGPDLPELARVTYNPWRAPHFAITQTGAPVHTAGLVVFAKASRGAEHGYAWI